MKHKNPERSDPSAATEERAGEDFLQRWSRRKASAREPGQLPATADEPTDAVPLADAPDEPPSLTDADMPPVESLTESSDVSGFFSPGVSDKLRRIALRKVFSLAVYNVRDGLDDYDEDFTVFEPLGDTVTADMRHRQEREAQRREREALERQQADSEENPAPVDAENPQAVADAEAAPQTAQDQPPPDPAAEQHDDEESKRDDA